MADVEPPPAALGRLRHAVGAAAIITDPERLHLLAQDVHSLGPEPLAIFRPADTAMLSRGLAAAHHERLAIVPRGGGMSYTRGYVADAPAALIVDMSGMDRILAVDETDMVATVEAGCTWAALYRELHPRGLRTPRWGTLSGLKATVGGGMSQNGMFWGGARGSIAPSALSMRVVLADGTVIDTGGPVLRPYGPDLTGLFAADSGAFGIKAEVTLPLEREAGALAFGSFAFDTPEAIFGALSEIGRQGLASEAFGFDPYLQSLRMRRASLAADAKALVGVMKAQGGFWQAVKEGARVVAAGRSFLDDAEFSLHVTCEGRSQAAADADMAATEAIVSRASGRAVENSIPKVLRANPFSELNSMLGPEGQRWVPVHGLVSHSKALPTLERIIGLFEANADAMERLGVGAGYMFVAVGTTAFLIEPCFYFPDEIAALHRATVEASHLAKLPGFPRNDEARALVDALRAGCIAIFQEVGGVHFQIGRTYPLKDSHDPAAWKLLQALKQAVDPDRRMNPGALGL
jgi:FAD/FMN-containing dehydrogenase